VSEIFGEGDGVVGSCFWGMSGDELGDVGGFPDDFCGPVGGKCKEGVGEFFAEFGIWNDGLIEDDFDFGFGGERALVQLETGGAD